MKSMDMKLCNLCQGWQNRSGNPGECRTNVSCMASEKLNFSTLHVDNRLLRSLCTDT